MKVISMAGGLRVGYIYVLGCKFGNNKMSVFVFEYNLEQCIPSSNTVKICVKEVLKRYYSQDQVKGA
jgi:hypothetical protein